ncbi:MAG: helix-turn-helix transcriptional regulator [Kofleriaceae bacterium]|nr:helix-turn-helix transcriptional regulator [Kofleriaceae bacterium]
MTTLGKRLGLRMRAARQAMAATQAEIAEELGISDKVYGRMERGQTLPSLSTFVGITEVLGVEASQLLANTGSKAAESGMTYGAKHSSSMVKKRSFRLIDQSDTATAEAMFAVLKALSDLSEEKSSSKR